MTRMAVMTTMMEKTPMSTPSSVRAERSLCEVKAFIAMRKLSRSSPRSRARERWRWEGEVMRKVRGPKSVSFAPERIHRIHPRRAPGGNETRHHARDQRHEQRHAHGGQRHLRRQIVAQEQRRGPGQAQC